MCKLSSPGQDVALSIMDPPLSQHQTLLLRLLSVKAVVDLFPWRVLPHPCGNCLFCGEGWGGGLT